MGVFGSFIKCKNFHLICLDFENCALLGYYATSSGNFLPTFQDNLSVPSSRVKNILGAFLRSLALEDGNDKLSRNVRQVPLFAA